MNYNLYMLKEIKNISKEESSFEMKLNVDEYRTLFVEILNIKRKIPYERFVDWFMEDLLFEFPKYGIVQRWSIDKIHVSYKENSFSKDELSKIANEFKTITNWNMDFIWK